MGASTVAGAIRTPPIERLVGTSACEAGAASPTRGTAGFSKCLRTIVFYRASPTKSDVTQSRHVRACMDENPKAFLEELRSGILKKRVGQIALAVVLAQAVWRLLNAFTWYVLVPIIGKAISGRTESVLFESAARLPFQWESIIGSLLEFTLTVILVFYLNRWIKNRSHWRPLQQRFQRHRLRFLPPRLLRPCLLNLPVCSSKKSSTTALAKRSVRLWSNHKARDKTE
jgi:large-conductance mechanosensitive channel